MIPSPLAEEKDVKPGNDAGFILAFHTEDENFKISDEPVCEISRDGYYAEIQASLPSALEGGVYSFVIEGLTDKDYGKISIVKNPTVKVIKLYLFWRDRVGVGDIFGGNLISVPDLAGSGNAKKHKDHLVAVLRIQSIKRKAGARKYETTITARERIYDLATRRPCGAEIDAKDLGTAAEELLRRVGRLKKDADFKFYPARANTLTPPVAVATEGDNERRLDATQTAVSLLQQIGQQLELASNLHGRGMLLVRDGALHIGPRPIPLDGETEDPKTLELSNGLIEVQPLDPLVIDANYEPCRNANRLPKVRAQFRLTLKGRPDLKPGDLVKFDVAPEDVAPKDLDLGSAMLALAGSIGGALVTSFLPGHMANPTVGYVHAVEHRLGRTSSFTTNLTVVALKQGQDLSLKPDDKWDAWSQGDAGRSPTQPAEANVETSAGKTIVRGVHSILDRLSFPEVGEVREVSSKTNETAPAQTLTIWRGLENKSGNNQARKADPVRPSESPAPTVPYLTPFAWGRCGLILPRYPGMRVAVVHRKANTIDPIEIGALWQTGHVTEKAELGDWWLSLPAEKPLGNAPGPDATGAPDDYSGKVTHDLVQADGVRIIEVGEFTIRVRKDQLGKAGGRPDAPSQKGALSIEHESGSKIVIDTDGNIQIETKADLNIKAKKVKVSCDSMDVS